MLRPLAALYTDHVVTAGRWKDSSLSYGHIISTLRHNLLSNSIAKFHLYPSPSQNMYPKPLRITQSIVLTLHLRKHDLPILWMPQKQIWNTTTPLLILLRHDFADDGESFTVETLDNLLQVIDVEGPVNANYACLLFLFAIVDFLEKF